MVYSKTVAFIEPFQLMLQYKIAEFQDVDEFLNIVAHKTGRLKRGGVSDRKMAAKKVLNDWNA